MGKGAYLVVPDFVVVENHGCAKASGWVDSGAGDGDGC